MKELAVLLWVKFIPASIQIWVCLVSHGLCVRF
jgi:hypothetical protein